MLPVAAVVLVLAYSIVCTAVEAVAVMTCRRRVLFIAVQCFPVAVAMCRVPCLHDCSVSETIIN